MPQLKLTYFDFPGRAEAARLALTIGGHSFTDERLIYDEYLVLYPDLPYGSVPILTVDNKVYAQSAAILRYCGRLSNLYPDDHFQAALVDEIIDTILDFIHGLELITDPEHITDEVIQMERVQTYFCENVPKYLGGINQRAQLSEKGTWLVHDQLSIADIALYVCLTNLSAGAFGDFDMSVLEPFPRLQTCFYAVQQHPKVKEWNEHIARQAHLTKEKALLEQVAHPDEQE